MRLQTLPRRLKAIIIGAAVLSLLPPCASAPAWLWPASPKASSKTGPASGQSARLSRG